MERRMILAALAAAGVAGLGAAAWAFEAADVDDQRTVIWLRFVADFSLTEVAEITSRTPDAVAALSHRGLRTLREALQP